MSYSNGTSRPGGGSSSAGRPPASSGTQSGGRAFQGIPYKVLLNAAHDKGLASLTTEVLVLPTPENEMLTVFKATVVGKDGQTCTGHGEARPVIKGYGAVGPQVIDSAFRMAETRAKARALMDFTNRGELEDDDEASSPAFVSSNGPVRTTAPVSASPPPSPTTAARVVNQAVAAPPVARALPPAPAAPTAVARATAAALLPDAHSSPPVPLAPPLVVANAASGAPAGVASEASDDELGLVAATQQQLNRLAQFGYNLDQLRAERGGRELSREEAGRLIRDAQPKAGAREAGQPR